MIDTKDTYHKPLTFAERKIASIVINAAKHDYARPEVRADFERWKKERAEKAGCVER